MNINLTVHPGNFVTNGNHFSKAYPIKIHICGIQSQLQYSSYIQDMGSKMKRMWKNFKSQRIKELALILCHRKIRSYTHKVSPARLLEYNMNKDNNRHTNMKKEKPKKQQPYCIVN